MRSMQRVIHHMKLCRS